MAKLINLMPLLLDINEEADFEESFAEFTNYPELFITDNGIEVRLENDTEKSYLDGINLDAKDRATYHKLCRGYSPDPDNREIVKLANQVNNGMDVCYRGGIKVIKNRVAGYIIGLNYGSYLREKYGKDCKFFVGSITSYGYSPNRMMCFFFGLTQGRSGYSDVFAYQRIRRHRYVESPSSISHKNVTDGKAVVSMVFMGYRVDSVFGVSYPPGIIKALKNVIGTEIPAILSESPTH